MNSPSVRAFSIYSPSDAHNHRIFRHQNRLFLRTTQSINQTHFQVSFSFHHKSPLPRWPIQLSFTKSPFSQPPVTDSISIQCSSSHHNNIFKPSAAKLILFLVFYGISFCGKLGLKPAWAVPISTPQGHGITVSESMEGKGETQNGKSSGDDLYVKLLESNPGDIRALKVVFYEKIRSGKVKEAVEYVEKMIETEPEEVEWRLLQALCYEMMGNLSKAKRLFKDILERRPLLVRALHGLALVMHKNQEGTAVFEMLNKALEVARCEKRVTEERNIRILIAQMHVVKGDLQEGLREFQDLVNENPRDFRPYLCQGIIYSLLDKKEEAEEQFEIYQSLVPDEFPQRAFLDDVMVAAKTEPLERFEKQFESEFSYRK